MWRWIADMSKKKNKQFHIPGLHCWFVSYKLDRKDVKHILSKIQEVLSDLIKKL